MTAIAPVLFDAFFGDAPHTQQPRHRSCVNIGASTETVEALSARYEEPSASFVALVLVFIGVLPLIAGICVVVGKFFSRAVPELPAPFFSMIGCGLALTVVAWACGSYLDSRFLPQAKAWRAALAEVWSLHGSRIVVMGRLSYPLRTEVQNYAKALESIREALNKMDPVGDELDGARQALQRYIEASDIPMLGKRAAEATHIKDPAVRQAAREYKRAIRVQADALRSLKDECESLQDLVKARQQACIDAELIRLVHER